ncbi:MAG: hypothetical protein IKA87_02840 [Lentisphaeria bacterium]|nr:hypothetical protein [Lentisphaeria bacterium]
MYDMIDPLPGALKLKMPNFTVAWTIVDLVMVALRTLELPFIVFFLIFVGKSGNAAFMWALIAELISVVLIAAAGLTGNIAMLCRRRWAVGICAVSAFFTFLSYAVLVWQLLVVYRSTSLLVLCCVIAGAAIFIMLRTALLVFNVISLVKARAFFRERDGF